MGCSQIPYKRKSDTVCTSAKDIMLPFIKKNLPSSVFSLALWSSFCPSDIQLLKKKEKIKIRNWFLGVVFLRWQMMRIDYKTRLFFVIEEIDEGYLSSLLSTLSLRRELFFARWASLSSFACGSTHDDNHSLKYLPLLTDSMKCGLWFSITSHCLWITLFDRKTAMNHTTRK